jgi:hypothetical protein
MASILVRPVPEQYVLRSGWHDPNGNGTPPTQACFMEFEAWLADKPWTDRMPCACPVIGAFMRSWNDSLPDDETRTRSSAASARQDRWEQSDNGN